MSSSRILICVCLALLCGAQMQAAEKPRIKDPQVIVAGAKGSLRVGSIFSFISPSGTSPITLPNGSGCAVNLLNLVELDCIFQNGTDSTWTGLNFTIAPGDQSGLFVCLPLSYFNHCFFNKDHTQLTFYGGTGIAKDDEFLIAVL